MWKRKFDISKPRYIITNILIVSPLALRYIEAPLDQWYKVGASGSMLTGYWYWNSWEFQTGKERENAAKNYSCLCPASDQASGVIYRNKSFSLDRNQKPNITKRKKTLPRRKEKLNVTRSRRIFAPFRVITNEKKAWEQSKHSIHGYPKSCVAGTKFSSLRAHIGPCPINITVMTVKVIHKCNLGKEYSKTRHNWPGF